MQCVLAFIYIVTSVPSPNQRCPKNSRGAPAHQSSRADRPHLRLINPPAQKQRAHRRRVRNLSMRQQPNLLSILFQTAVCNRSAPPRAPHRFTRTWTRLRAPQQARAPHLSPSIIKSTLWGLKLVSRCRMILPPCHTGGECGHVSGRTNDLPFLFLSPLCQAADPP